MASHDTQSKIAFGRGGMFLVETKVALKPGALVSFDIKFEVGPIKRMEGIGTIMWKRDENDKDGPAGYGIDFTYISPSTLPNWLAFLESSEILAVIPNDRLQAKDASLV